MQTKLSKTVISVSLKELLIKLLFNTLYILIFSLSCLSCFFVMDLVYHQIMFSHEYAECVRILNEDTHIFCDEEPCTLEQETTKKPVKPIKPLVTLNDVLAVSLITLGFLLMLYGGILCHQK